MLNKNTQDTEIKINPNYQYEEDDLQALNKKSLIENAEWVEPVSLKGLDIAITKLPKTQGEKLLLELNLGGSHWVGVGIERLTDGKLSVVYMDSLDPTKQMPDRGAFKAVLKTLGVKGENISFTTYAHCWGQGSNVACGAYAHENLKRWANNKGAEKKPRRS